MCLRKSLRQKPLNPNRHQMQSRRQLRNQNLRPKNRLRPKSVVGGHAAKDIATCEGLRDCGALLSSPVRPKPRCRLCE